jgi:hypothetical protein
MVRSSNAQLSKKSEPRLPRDGIGGAALAVRSNGQTFFYNYGWADGAVDHIGFAVQPRIGP